MERMKEISEDVLRFLKTFGFEPVEREQLFRRRQCLAFQTRVHTIRFAELVGRNEAWVMSRVAEMVTDPIG